MIWDAIIDFVIENEKIQYDRIIAMTLVYLAFLWMVVSVWVVTDAYNRYQRKYLAFVWGVIVFVANFPSLIIYFLVRPEEDLSDIIAGAGSEAPSNLIPIASLIDDNGDIKLQFELRISANGEMVVQSEGTKPPIVTKSPDDVEEKSKPKSEVVKKRRRSLSTKVAAVFRRVKASIRMPRLPELKSPAAEVEKEKSTSTDKREIASERVEEVGSRKIGDRDAAAGDRDAELEVRNSKLEKQNRDSKLETSSSEIEQEKDEAKESLPNKEELKRRPEKVAAKRKKRRRRRK